MHEIYYIKEKIYFTENIIEEEGGCKMVNYLRFTSLLVFFILLNNCNGLHPQVSPNYYALHADIEGLKEYKKTHATLDEVNSNSGETPLVTAIKYSLNYCTKKDNKKRYEVIKFLIENGANLKNVQVDQRYDLFNYSLLGCNRDIIKLLIDNGVTIHDFEIPKIKYVNGGYVNQDRTTACSFKKYVCANQKFAKEYYHKLQLQKEAEKQESINRKIDAILGL